MILAHLNKMSSINYLTHQLFPLTSTPLKSKLPVDSVTGEKLVRLRSARPGGDDFKCVLLQVSEA